MRLKPHICSQPSITNYKLFAFHHEKPREILNVINEVWLDTIKFDNNVIAFNDCPLQRKNESQERSSWNALNHKTWHLYPTLASLNTVNDDIKNGGKRRDFVSPEPSYSEIFSVHNRAYIQSECISALEKLSVSSYVRFGLISCGLQFLRIKFSSLTLDYSESICGYGE